MRILVISASLMLAACAAHVTSRVRVDGVPFVPSTCQSGQANGFSGVELADPAGRRLRLTQNPNGTLTAFYFPSGSTVGDALDACFTMNAQPGAGVVNGIRNVAGRAVLDCRTERHQVSGDVQFENCH